MKLERWQQIDELFQAALEREPAERAAYLDEACGGDQALRKEVESLLKSDEQAERFIETPAFKEASHFLADHQPESMVGRAMGPYEIVALLGAGGMGEVYLAQDARLNRRVALKLLPACFTRDDERSRRFEQEARAASALNHPNIVTIYEIGQSDGTQFITTEFIDGVTLRSRITAGRIELSEALDIALQVASALAAAHQAGVVHRDIKPENVMLRRDGYVKVLDFGLAKHTVPRGIPTDTGSPTAPEVKTSAGVVMGTTNYMSPEQARGLVVDQRTDIFSLGVVIYEMITGRLPFEGETNSDVIASILHHEPPPLARYSREAPEALERIVTKALRKSREERYQTGKELVSDLRSLKQRLESQVEPERSIPPGSSNEPTIDRTAGRPMADARERHAQAGDVAARKTSSVVARHKFAFAAAAFLVATVIGLNLPQIRDRLASPGAPAPIRSLAVLPLVNLSGDPGQDHFADGMTDALIAHLCQIRTLRVISLTSSMSYKGTKKSVPEIAGELDVDAVVEGSLLRSGDSVRITARMIQAATDKPLWGQTYERDFRNVLALLSEVARAIAGEISVTVTPQTQARLASVRPSNPEAFIAYSRGRHFWNQRTEEGLRKAIEYFKEAIHKDPGYALAYDGLADCWLPQAWYAYLPAREAFPRAKEAVTKALELDDSLAEAHTTQAFINLYYDWDWAAAERGFRRAIDLNPNYPNAHHWYAEYLSLAGRQDQAIAESELARELDPNSSIINSWLGWRYHFVGQYDKAVGQIRVTLEMDPNFVPGRLVLGQAYIQKGMLKEAIAELETAATLSGGSPVYVASLAHAFAVAGRKQQALKLLDDLKELSGRRFVSSYDMALAVSGLGNKDQTLAWLQKAVEERSPRVLFVKLEPRFNALRSDSRFHDLVTRIGFPH